MGDDDASAPPTSPPLCAGGAGPRPRLQMPPTDLPRQRGRIVRAARRAARRHPDWPRHREVDLPALLEASVMALSGLPGTQTTIYANYVELAGQTLAPSAFCDRFTKPYAELLRELAGRAVAAVRAVDEKEPALAELG